MNQQVMAVGDVCGVVAVTGVTASVKQPYNLQYFYFFYFVQQRWPCGV
jgi:hypothetical protein